MNHRHLRPIITVTAIASLLIGLTACEGVNSWFQNVKGSLVGNSYTITGYDNYGVKSLEMSGDKISLSGDTSRDSDGKTVVDSSVVTVTIDGASMESVGDTLIFEGDGLKPAKDFSADYVTGGTDNSGLDSLTSAARPLNEYKNLFGKSRVIVIKSQLGKPIRVYTGDSVSCSIPDDLPKTTKCSIDSKPLYIHRANYQIIDTQLLQ